MMMDVMGLVTNFVVADWSCEHPYTLILLPPAPGPSASVLPHYGVSNGEWTAVGTFFLQYVPNNSHSFQERDAGGERRVGNEQVLSSIFRGRHKWLGNNDRLFQVCHNPTGCILTLNRKKKKRIDCSFVLRYRLTTRDLPPLFSPR